MKMFIDDRWVEASDGAWTEICNPGTGDVIDRVPRGTLEDVTRVRWLQPSTAGKPCAG